MGRGARRLVSQSQASFLVGDGAEVEINSIYCQPVLQLRSDWTAGTTQLTKSLALAAPVDVCDSTRPGLSWQADLCMHFAKFVKLLPIIWLAPFTNPISQHEAASLTLVVLIGMYEPLLPDLGPFDPFARWVLRASSTFVICWVAISLICLLLGLPMPHFANHMWQ
jgi:hypothetical protein